MSGTTVLAVSLVVLFLAPGCSFNVKRPESFVPDSGKSEVGGTDLHPGELPIGELPRAEEGVEQETRSPDQVAECAGDGECDDADPCTADQCQQGRCVHILVPGACGPCVEAGGSYEEGPEAVGCCADLQSIPACEEEMLACANWCWPPFSCDCEGVTTRICARCGDTICEAGENGCNCPGDCLGEMPNWCADGGGLCAVGDPEEEPCPPGHGPSDIPGCPDGKHCCMPSGECVKAGGKISPGQFCCQGLKEIALGLLNPVTKDCDGKSYASVCSKCGGGLCEKEWEDYCNCPSDCPAPGQCYNDGDCEQPPEPCLQTLCIASMCVVQAKPGCGGPSCSPMAGNCPPETYCKLPAGSCNFADQEGSCVLMSGACPGILSPVCGCNGSTYGNECEMEQAAMSMLSPGECTASSVCVKEGEEAFTEDGIVPFCCAGLAPIPYCHTSDNGGCDCDPVLVCAKCGNGLCGPAENKCNCLEDCKQ